jgi:hypothetical protein
MLDRTKDFLSELKALRKEVKAERVTQIAKKHLREKAEQLGSQWCTSLSGELSQSGAIPSEVLERYTEYCSRLIVLSSPNNLKTSYIETLDGLIKPFRSELILPLQRAPSVSGSLALLHRILGTLPDPQENDYLKEACSCAQRGFFRAGVVLGWCATMDRIQRRIEQLGFGKFNVASVQMAGQQKGRFKRFSSPQNVNSLSELREVFDAVVLWVIEGMGMIDSNQHTRLSSCFEMRCQCAHPGDATVTEFNLMSFFSDINQIIFQNPMFKL